MQYLIPIIAFLGLPLGKLIAHFTKDELKQGAVYFYAAKKILLFIVAVILALNITLNYELIVPFILGILAAKYLKLVYAWLALSMVSLQNQEIVISSLIFIYGLLYATNNKGFVKELLSFIIPFSLLLIPSYTILSFSLQYYLTPFIMGALLFTSIFRD